nr:hypothetical protein [Acuticoccus mangrovi]
MRDDGGVEQKQAEAHAAAVQEFVVKDLVTKDDLGVSFAKLDASLGERLSSVEDRVRHQFSTLHSDLATVREKLNSFDSRFAPIDQRGSLIDQRMQHLTERMTELTRSLERSQSVVMDKLTLRFGAMFLTLALSLVVIYFRKALF